MVKLISVLNSNSNNEQFYSRQIPLQIDDSLTLLMEINDIQCIECEQIKYLSINQLNNNNSRKKEYDSFLLKYKKIFPSTSSSTTTDKIKIQSNNLLNTLTQLVPCVGCRTSVERFYKQLIDLTRNNRLFNEDDDDDDDEDYEFMNRKQILSYALDPLVIDKNGYLAINENSFNPKSLFELFYMHGSRLDSLLDAIPKIKKNRRCHLHSLDTQKTKNSNDWLEVWDSMTNECRKQSLIINTDNLLHALDYYLRKHRFCSECKNKVLRAFKLLVGELDVNKEKGYCAHLYDGIQCCAKHIHVKCDKMFVLQLIRKAETEIQGSRRERHAKTIDIAQEEVLTCIGTYVYDRYHRICQSMKSEEQTWQLLYHVGVYSLRKCFEFELEKLNEKSQTTIADASQNGNNKRSNKKKSKLNSNSNSNTSTKTSDVVPVVAPVKTVAKSQNKKIPLCTNYDSENDELCECHHRQLAFEETDDEEEEEKDCNCCDAVSTTTTATTCSSPVSSIGHHNKCWHHHHHHHHNSNITTLTTTTATTTSINSMSSSSSGSCCEINNSVPLASVSSISQNRKLINDAGYSSEHESNTCLELCCNVDNITCNIEQCKYEEPFELISCNEILITEIQTCNCDLYNCNNLHCDIISYSKILEQTGPSLIDDKLDDKTNMITDEEKKEYYANKTVYLKKRNAHRIKLKEKLRTLNHNNFQVKPRNNL